MKKLYCQIFGGCWEEGETTYCLPGYIENIRMDIKIFFERDVQSKILSLKIWWLEMKIKYNKK